MSRTDPEKLWQASGAGDFVGAKAAVYLGDKLLCLLRDDKPGLSFANKWDFPGGGRDPGESPFETLAREVDEEVGLDVAPDQIVWHWHGESDNHPGQLSWFFVLHLPEDVVRTILMGDEGGAWALMPPERFLELDDAVPSLQARLRLWLQEEAHRGEG